MTEADALQILAEYSPALVLVLYVARRLDTWLSDTCELVREFAALAERVVDDGLTVRLVVQHDSPSAAPGPGGSLVLVPFAPGSGSERAGQGAAGDGASSPAADVAGGVRGNA